MKIGDTTFIYSTDLSGVRIIREGEELTVPGADLLGFAAEIVRQQRERNLEFQPRQTVLFGCPCDSGSWPEVTE